MSYALVLEPPPDPAITRDVGENVFLGDLSSDYKVFVFYYPSAMRDEELEEALRGLGDLTGKNLLVNIGKLNDPQFDKIVRTFEITKFPVVVVTATADFGGVPELPLNTFVRIDGRLMADPSRAVVLVQELYGLFLRGEIADAISKTRSTQRAAMLGAIARKVTAGLRRVGDFVADRDFKISFLEGTFELTKSGH